MPERSCFERYVLDLFRLTLSLSLTLVAQEIRELLLSWSDDFDIAERVWVRGSQSGLATFWGHEGAQISKSELVFRSLTPRLELNIVFSADERIRTFPFPTRRPVS